MLRKIAFAAFATFLCSAFRSSEALPTTRPTTSPSTQPITHSQAEAQVLAAKNTERKAEADCLRRLEKTSDYRTAKARVDAARQRARELSDPNSSHDKWMEASRELMDDVQILKNMEDNAIFEDQAVTDAKVRLDDARKVESELKASRIGQGPADNADPISKAIRSGKLIKGMTLDQVNRSIATSEHGYSWKPNSSSTNDDGEAVVKWLIPEASPGNQFADSTRAIMAVFDASGHLSHFTDETHKSRHPGLDETY